MLCSQLVPRINHCRFKSSKKNKQSSDNIPIRVAKFPEKPGYRHASGSVVDEKSRDHPIIHSEGYMNVCTKCYDNPSNGSEKW